MSNRSNRICPVEKADSLDTKTRRLFQNPRRILKPYIKSGMAVLDFGCGPGFFTLDMARMVGPSGRVIAADLQEGMLRIVRDKINGTELENRIILHKCEPDKIGLTDNVDFALLFYIVHEIPHKDKFFQEIAALLKPQGRAFIVEPPFHVNKQAFQTTLDKARAAGLEITASSNMFFKRHALLIKV